MSFCFLFLIPDIALIRALLHRYHYSCVKVREAQVQLIGKFPVTFVEKEPGEEDRGMQTVDYLGRVYRHLSPLHI